MQLEFLKPARMDDVLDIVTRPLEVRGASITLHQEVRRGAAAGCQSEGGVCFGGTREAYTEAVATGNEGGQI